MLKLEIGDTIGLCAPCSHILPEELIKVKEFFEGKNIKVITSTNILNRERFCAGTDEERASDLMELWHNKEIKVIFALRGGYGSIRILDKLDYDFISSNPKIFCGFSDATAINLALFKKANLLSYSGAFLIRDIDENLTIKSLINASLFNPSNTIISGNTLITGMAQGKLLGGNLSILCSMIGTHYLPDFKDKILVIEEVGEKFYKIDRLVQQLRLSGIFEEIKGLIIGKFYKCQEGTLGDGTIKDILDDIKNYINCPAIFDFDYSHNEDRYILPIGKECSLDAEKCEIKIK